jgi:hypothetical protein
MRVRVCIATHTHREYQDHAIPTISSRIGTALPALRVTKNVQREGLVVCYPSQMNNERWKMVKSCCAFVTPCTTPSLLTLVLDALGGPWS